MTPSIAWGPWRPDAIGPNTGFARVADNVLPKAAGVGQGGILLGYGPFPQPVTPVGAGALSGMSRGSISLVTQGGTSEVFFATASTIAQLQADYTFSSIDTGRTVTAGDDVSFLQFGSYLLNTDTTDGFKAYNLESPAGNNAVSGAPSSPRSVFSCNNVVFLLDVGGNNKAWKSSAVGDHTNWTSLGANGGVFPDGGANIKGVDLKNGNGVIFQKNAIRLIQFGNAVSPALFSIVKAADGRGSVGARSIVSFDGRVFFLDSSGFYKFDLSNGVTAIGAEKFDAWFLSQIDSSRLGEVQGVIDPKNKLVLWRFPSVANQSASVFDRVIGYNWDLDEAFTLTLNTGWLSQLATPGYVLDNMNSFGVLDSITTLLDDRFWQGGAAVLAMLDSNLKYATFSGLPLAATLQSYLSDAPVSTLNSSAKPISDDVSSTLQIGTQLALSDAITWRDPVGRSRAGKVPIRGLGTNIAFQSNHAASAPWTYDTGVDYVSASGSGRV